MAKEKRSFFERLTGSAPAPEAYDDMLDAPAPTTRRAAPRAVEMAPAFEEEADTFVEEDTGEGQLTVDVYQTPDNIIITTMVAGVNPSDLDISITRDMVTIRGNRNEKSSASDEDYFHKELYWGSFSRTILLPQEVEVEEAEALEKHGLLTLTLPKIDKERQTKLKVKVG